MGTINIGRWLVGGIVAGIVLLVIDFILNGLILAQQWRDAFAALGKPATENAGTFLVFALVNLIIGLTAVLIYVGIRPRFGPGVRTAIYAGLATWLLADVAANLVLLNFGLLPASLLWIGIVVGVIQIPVATVAGAYLYKEG